MIEEDTQHWPMSAVTWIHMHMYPPPSLSPIATNTNKNNKWKGSHRIETWFAYEK